MQFGARLIARQTSRRRFTTFQNNLTQSDYDKLVYPSARRSDIESFLPGRCSVWLEVQRPQVDTPWQNRARLPWRIRDGEEVIEQIMILIVRDLEPGFHQVELEFDPDIGTNGRLNVWKDGKPVHGPLTSPKGYLVAGIHTWAGLRTSLKRRTMEKTDLLPILGSRHNAPLMKIVERDKQSNQIALARQLPLEAPRPSIEDWDPALLKRFMDRLPAGLRGEVERFDSPHVRAQLCMRAAERLMAMPYVDGPTLNIVTSLQPGESRVRVCDARDVTQGHRQTVSGKIQVLPLTLVSEAGEVTQCFFPWTDCAALTAEPLDLEYGMLPIFVDYRLRGGRTHGYGRDPDYGLSLSHGRSVLLKSISSLKAGFEAEEKRPRPTFHALKRSTTLTSSLWPGLFRLIDQDRKRAPVKRLPPLKAVKMIRESNGRFNIVGNTEFSSQMFEPDDLATSRVLFPERLPGVLILPREADTIRALIEGKIPHTGLSAAVIRRLETLEPHRQQMAIDALLNYFQFYRGTGYYSTTPGDVDRSIKAGNHLRLRALPQTINFMETHDDLNQLQAFVHLDKVLLDWFLLEDDGAYMHYKVELRLPASLEDVPPYGLVENAKMGYPSYHSFQIEHQDGTPISSRIDQKGVRTKRSALFQKWLGRLRPKSPDQIWEDLGKMLRARVKGQQPRF